MSPGKWMKCAHIFLSDYLSTCSTCYLVVKLPGTLTVLPEMVSFLEVSGFVICLIGELGWAKASSEMISLVANSKGFGAQHKGSIRGHCLEFRKTPSAALCTNAYGFFFLFLLWRNHASQHIEWLVFQFVGILCMINNGWGKLSFFKDSQSALTKWQDRVPKRLRKTAVLQNLSEKLDRIKITRGKRTTKYLLCLVKYFQRDKTDSNMNFPVF